MSGRQSSLLHSSRSKPGTHLHPFKGAMGGQQQADQDVSAPRVLGFRLGGTRQTQFLTLAGGCVACAVAFAAFQESVYRVPDFHYSGWMTFLTYLVFVSCATTERFLTSDGNRRGMLQDYAFVALTGMCGVYLTNWALQYLNYTVRVVFKSCKVIPVMLFGTILQGRTYNREEYFACVLLVAGISLFTAGGKSGTPNFNPIGVLLISLALVCDAVTSNLEERLFFRKAGSSQAEVVAFMSVFGLVYSGAALLITGEAWPAVAHSIEHPQTIPLIGGFSVMGYMSFSLVLLLIKHFNAQTTEVVKSMRKVLQVLVSFIIFPKPFDWKYVAGGGATVAALWWLQKIKRAAKVVKQQQVVAAAVETQSLLEQGDHK